MSDFKGRHFEGEIVLCAGRWYRRYGVSYRDLEQMMGERGVVVDHSTIYRWAQKYMPEMEKRLRWQWRTPRSTSWRVDKTYVKVRGEWAYLYRAVDKHGNTVDFYLSPTCNTAAAKRFLGKAVRGLKEWEKSEVINTDKAPTYAAALAELKQEGKCPKHTLHRQVKYLNNVIEPDHGKLKQLIRPVRGFKTHPTAYATIRGFEVMRALRKGQASAFNVMGDIRGEARIVERAFRLGASALAEVVQLINSRLEAKAVWRGSRHSGPNRRDLHRSLQQSHFACLVAKADKIAASARLIQTSKWGVAENAAALADDLAAFAKDIVAAAARAAVEMSGNAAITDALREHAQRFGDIARSSVCDSNGTISAILRPLEVTLGALHVRMQCPAPTE